MSDTCPKCGATQVCNECEKVVEVPVVAPEVREAFCVLVRLADDCCRPAMATIARALGIEWKP